MIIFFFRFPIRLKHHEFNKNKILSESKTVLLLLLLLRMTVTPYQFSCARCSYEYAVVYQRRVGIVTSDGMKTKGKFSGTLIGQKPITLPGHAMMAFETKTKQRQRRRRNNNNRNIIISFDLADISATMTVFGWVAGSLSCCSILSSPLVYPEIKFCGKKINTSGRPTGAFVPGWFWKTFWTVAL